jgi:hypothetical protein
MSRLLALLVALTALLPTQAWARLAELCGEPDTCCCRREGEEPAPEPEVRRVDCCESACVTSTAPANALPTRGEDIVAPAAGSVAFVVARPRMSTAASAPLLARPRGPPRALFVLVEHWLL